MAIFENILINRFYSSWSYQKFVYVAFISILDIFIDVFPSIFRVYRMSNTLGVPYHLGPEFNQS